MKSNDTKDITKKTKFTKSEWNEICQAMDEEGYSTYREYILNMTRTRRNKTDAEQRRQKKFYYECYELKTYLNQIERGINVKENMKRFVKEAETLCQGLM